MPDNNLSADCTVVSVLLSDPTLADSSRERRLHRYFQRVAEQTPKSHSKRTDGPHLAGMFYTHNVVPYNMLSYFITFCLLVQFTCGMSTNRKGSMQGRMEETFGIPGTGASSRTTRSASTGLSLVPPFLLKKRQSEYLSLVSAKAMITIPENRKRKRFPNVSTYCCVVLSIGQVLCHEDGDDAFNIFRPLLLLRYHEKTGAICEDGVCKKADRKRSEQRLPLSSTLGRCSLSSPALVGSLLGTAGSPVSSISVPAAATSLSSSLGSESTGGGARDLPLAGEASLNRASSNLVGTWDLSFLNASGVLVLLGLRVTIEVQIRHDVPSGVARSEGTAETEDLTGEHPPDETNSVTTLVVGRDGNVDILGGRVGIAKSLLRSASNPNISVGILTMTGRLT